MTNILFLNQENIPEDVLIKSCYNKSNVKFWMFKKNFPCFYEELKKLCEKTEDFQEEDMMSILRRGIWIKEPNKIKVLNNLINFSKSNFSDLDDHISFSVYGNPTYLILTMSCSGFCLEITTGQSYDFSINPLSNEYKIECAKKPFARRATDYILFYYDDGSIYHKYDNNGTNYRGKKWIPITLSKLFWMLPQKDVFKVLIDEYIQNQLNQKRYTWKDLKPYIDNKVLFKHYFPPITVKEINSSHSLDDLMKTKYKRANFVNWNKYNIEWCYYIMKTLPKLTKESQIHLLNMKEMYSPTDIVDNKLIKDSMDSYIFNKLDPDSYPTYRGKKISEYNMHDIVYDYLLLCRELKKKINLCHVSGTKLNQDHNEMSKLYEIKCTPLIKIPKNSKFKELRKLLPETFEQIKTKKRIVEEGIKMHNCVSTYAPLINKDVCAIYSLVYDNEPYTIEFRKNDKNHKYCIRQLYGVCNSDAPDEVWQYVSGILDTQNMKQNVA